MTTYVICDKCGKKFKSDYQIDNLENEISGNTETCKECGKTTLSENRNMVNE